MARKVFFSFHYDRDVRRVVQVRNSWVVRAKGEAQPFLDKADWESIQRKGDATIEKWIEDQLSGTAVTVVLFGAETYDRPWVKHEIKRSYQLDKGILAMQPQSRVSLCRICFDSTSRRSWSRISRALLNYWKFWRKDFAVEQFSFRVALLSMELGGKGRARTSSLTCPARSSIETFASAVDLAWVLAPPSSPVLCNKFTQQRLAA